MAKMSHVPSSKDRTRTTAANLQLDIFCLFVQQCFQYFPKCRQPRPRGAFPWLWRWCRPTSKAKDKRPGDEVEVSPQVREYGFRNPRNLCLQRQESVKFYLAESGI